MTKLTLDQIIYYNGVSYTVENEGKKVQYSIEITYPNGSHNLMTDSAMLTAKNGKKVMFNISFDKLTFKREDKQNTKSKSMEGDLSIVKSLISGISISDLSDVDQNLFILCSLLNEYINEDDELQVITSIPKQAFLELVVFTGEMLSNLNYVHTLEFSRMYRVALRDPDVKEKINNFLALKEEINLVTKDTSKDDLADLTNKIQTTKMLVHHCEILNGFLTNKLTELKVK